MLPENKYAQFGFPREQILGITIHETGNTEMSARDLFDWMANESRTNQGTHYFVDSEETVEVMPLNYGVYHTGKGMDWGNKYTIAIEICSSFSDEKYQQAQDRAVQLIKQLQNTYHIPNDMVFFHNDFNERVYCPKTILNRYGTSKSFVYQCLEED